MSHSILFGSAYLPWMGIYASDMKERMTSTRVNNLRICIYVYTVYSYVVVAMNFACRKHDRYKLVTSRNRLADRSDEVQRGTCIRSDATSVRGPEEFLYHECRRRKLMSGEHLTQICFPDLSVPVARRCAFRCYLPSGKLCEPITSPIMAAT